MLKTLVVSNFVDFREMQILNFQKGPNFVIGANSSGKSALFELTRRCLSKKSNPKVSYIPDKSKPAYTLCNFEMNQELANKVSKEMEVTDVSSISASSDKTARINTSMYSCCFVNENPSTKKQQLFKLIGVYGSPMANTNIRMYIQRFQLEGNFIAPADSYVEWEGNSGSNSELANQFVNLDKAIHVADKNKDIDKSVRDFCCSLNKLKEPPRSVEGSEPAIIEKILRQLDRVVVVTFPVRGHGPLQWNQNPEVGKVDGGYGKYRNASDGAVILHALLGSPDVDHQEADKTFTELISPNVFVFRKQEKQGNSNPSESNTDEDRKYEIVVEKHDHIIPLMKVPEGILEARHFSLLLAHKNYQTICFEEPGRGMHPPMVHRVRDLLLRKQKGKTLIVISHKPSMINFWAFDRMFVSRNILKDGKPCHSVKRIGTAMLRRYQEENFRKMLFSSSVLFIEGPTDRIVMGAIFDEILQTDLNTLDGEERLETQKRQRLVTEISMIEIEGSTGYNPYKKLSTEILVPYLFLFDKDSVFISDPKIKLNKMKGSKARFEIISACLALADGDSIETFAQTEVVAKTSAQPEQEKGKLRKEPVSKAGDYISSKTPASMIRTIVEDMYLPMKETKLCAKVKTADIFDLQEGDPNEMSSYSDRRVFIWQTGNIEDVIIKSIIDVKDDNDMMELFKDIVRCKRARPGKELLKEAILDIDQQKARKLACHLLKCKEVTEFFEFMDRRLALAI